ncbi:DUF2889 domain-containing protein [Ferrovibrio sp. MS7]|jgi:hypothetical protein|uniref:DUF2889 domain-containing protein n=1 Tax=Ferrovibrio plantarum TaxID=3119164 RepID=UPI001B43C945|nr:DUF2889 domain-containing protein [Ferrovibrio sp.]
MPLSAPAPRRHFHTRAIEAQGFRRDDGLWDVEAHIRDTKAYDYEEFYRGKMPAGRPVHAMSIRLTFGDDMIVKEVEAVTDAAPYSPCQDVAPRFQQLVGLRIGGGWRMQTRQRLGGTKGCTHMVELLDVIATVAFQTITSGHEPEKRSAANMWHSEGDKPPYYLDGCHSWNRSGEVVRAQLPQFYIAPAPADPKDD